MGKNRSSKPRTTAAEGKDLSHVPCKFFKAGSCTVGATCPFSHTSIEPGQKEVCTWFVKGGCKFGHKCALAHILPGQNMAMDRKNKKAAQQQAKVANKGRDGGHAESSGLNRNEGRTLLLSAEETTKYEGADVAPDDSREIITETKPSFFPHVAIPSPPSSIFKSTSPEVNEFSAIGSTPAFAFSRNRGPLSNLPPGTSPSKGLEILPPSPFPAPGHQATFASYDRVQDSLDSRSPAGSAASLWENQVFASKLVPPSQRPVVLRTYPSEGSAVEEEDLVLDPLTDLFTPEERFRRTSRSKADAGGLLHPSTEPHYRHSWADFDHHWTKSQPTHQTTSNSEDQTVRINERGPSTPKRPTLGVLVEIDPEPHRGLGEITYQIASDLPSPTTTVSSTETDESGEEHDTRSPSSPFEPLNGSSLEKRPHIDVPPRGPKLGDRKSHTMNDAIVPGDRFGGESKVQARDRFGTITPSTATGSDPSTSSTPNSQNTRMHTNQGGSPHDLLRTGGLETGLATALPVIDFKCRICLSDPTPSSNLTATHCGHLFCYECIAADVLKTSRCPVCQNALALYCLFKLDVVLR